MISRVNPCSVKHIIASELLALPVCSHFRHSESSASPPKHPAPVSTSTFRATKKLCHSTVPPVPTWAHHPLRFPPCFASLLPLCAVKGAMTPRNRRKHHENRASKADLRQGNRRTQSCPGSGPQ